MTDEQAVLLTFSYLASKGEALSNDYRPRIVELIPHALQALAEALASDPALERRDLLRREFTLPAVVGSVGDFDLTDALADGEPLLMSHLMSAVFTHAALPYPLQPLPGPSLGALKSSPLFGYWWVEGATVHTTGTDGEPLLEDELLVFASYRPEIDRIEGQLSPVFIVTLAGMVVAGKEMAA